MKALLDILPPEPDFKPHRLIAVGDIHGQYRKLVSLMEKIDLNPREDLLIFMGDYIDRGESDLEESQTIMYLVELANNNRGRVILLKGNHEQMAEDAIKNRRGEYWELWRANGAKGKLKWGDGALAILKDFCEMLPFYYETDTHLFVHAGALDNVPIQDQDLYHVIWDRDLNQNGYFGKTLVVGHTPRKEVLVTPEVICVDTGAYYYGTLSAYDVLNGTVYSTT